MNNDNKFETVFKDCLDEVKRQRDMSQQKTAATLQGINSARRHEEKEAKLINKIMRDDTMRVTTSLQTMSSPRGDVQYFDQEMLKGESLKNFEKRRVVEKFLQNDEIFYKLLQFVNPVAKQQMKEASKSKPERHEPNAIEAMNEDILSQISPQINHITNNNNCNFFIQTSLSQREEPHPVSTKASFLSQR